jgi:hypothetical protein
MQKREESSAQLNKMTDGFAWSSHLEHFKCGVMQCTALIFQVHLLLVLQYLQSVYLVESTCVYEWTYHQQIVVNESTNKMGRVQTYMAHDS